MWKKIESLETVESIVPDSHISEDPNNPEDFYQVRAVIEGFVVALHANGKVRLKSFEGHELVNKWWFKTEEIRK